MMANDKIIPIPKLPEQIIDAVNKETHWQSLLGQESQESLVVQVGKNWLMIL